MLPQKHFCGQFFETVTGETSQAKGPAFDNRSALTHAAGSPCCAPLQWLRPVAVCLPDKTIKEDPDRTNVGHVTIWCRSFDSIYCTEGD